MAKSNEYRDFIRRCMLLQNVKGTSAEEVRAAMSECANLWREKQAQKRAKGAEDLRTKLGIT